MLTLHILRQPSTDQGTPGMLEDFFQTGELPWKNNAVDISCIPVGTYECQWLWSDRWQRFVYHVMNVPGRTVVEIHLGNWFGDTTKGFKSDVDGCIILGLAKGILLGQAAVLESGAAIAQFEKFMNGQTFMLEISNAINFN